MLDLNPQLWLYDGGVVLLSVVNAFAWFRAIKDVGDPSFTIGFFLRLGVDGWFLLAIFASLAASVLGYWVLFTLGIGAGRLFLEVGLIATVVTSQFLLKQGLHGWQVVGFAAVIAGALLVNT